MNPPGITIVGLGPGDPGLLTRQAWELLEKSEEIYLRTRLHPTVAGFPERLRVHSFDHFYEEGYSFAEVYENIVNSVLTLGMEGKGIVYGVPGHPLIAEATTPEIARRAEKSGIQIKIIDGMSFLEPIFSLLEVDPFPQTSLIDALELATDHHPPFPPDSPAVIAQIHSPTVAADIKLTLMAVYPDQHQVQLIHGAGTKNAVVEFMPLYEIDRNKNIGMQTALYLPPLKRGTSFEEFQEIVAHLRSPEGCPWDRDQTHKSLRPYLLEETYEVLAALDAGDQEALGEELGDLLLQVVLHAQIASEYGEFSMGDVLVGINKKLIRRHPHVFGDIEVDDKKKVVENWEKIKLNERQHDSKKKNGILEGVSMALPALVQAQSFQQRVNRVGFDWQNIQGVYEKISEEIAEINEAESPEEQESEIGDLLFAVVNLSRWLNIDAESSLRSANARFKKRFEALEANVKTQGRDVSSLTLEELDALWNTVKMAGDD